jgi:hypothetical protein
VAWEKLLLSHIHNSVTFSGAVSDYYMASRVSSFECLLLDRICVIESLPRACHIVSDTGGHTFLP